MGHISKPLKVAPLISGSLIDEEVDTVTLPVGVEYFRITCGSGGGNLKWAWKEADLATGAHTVLAGKSTDNIIANPLSLAVEATGGAVTYEIFVVIEGK